MTVRRRRTPEAAEREILDAAEPLLRARGLRELTVTEVMAHTTLTRNSFYVYFRDLYDLVARLVQRLRVEADARMAAFEDPRADPAVAGREALAAAARLWAEHGELLVALAEAARHDRAAARAWKEFTEPAERSMIGRVREEVAGGRVAGIEPESTVRALVAMNRACFQRDLVGKRDPDVDGVVDTLHRIWTRTLYGG